MSAIVKEVYDAFL